MNRSESLLEIGSCWSDSKSNESKGTKESNESAWHTCFWLSDVAHRVQDSADKHDPNDDVSGHAKVQASNERQENNDWELLDVIHRNSHGLLDVDPVLILKVLGVPAGALIWQTQSINFLTVSNLFLVLFLVFGKVLRSVDTFLDFNDEKNRDDVQEEEVSRQTHQNVRVRRRHNYVQCHFQNFKFYFLL